MIQKTKNKKDSAGHIKIIDGTGVVMGRLASYVAKEALKGEEIAVLNCEDIIISGNRQMNREHFEARRRRAGSGFKGPIQPRPAYMMVKRAIRGMVPQYRYGRGREAFKRIKCYNNVPEEFKNSKKIILEYPKPKKYSKVKEFVEK